jgi:hypothetical protein
MDGAAGSIAAAADPGGGPGRPRRKRRLGAQGVGLVVVCAAAAAVAVWAGLRYVRGHRLAPDRSIPHQEAYQLPSGFATAVDSGIKNVGPLPSSGPAVSDASTGG